MSQPGGNCLTFPVTALTVTSPSSLSRTPPTSFVTRQGSKLLLDNATFKAVGPNVYWLGLDENINASISYPTPQRVLEIMATAAAMGATTIRATTLGVSIGHPLAISPSLGTFSEEALRVVDFAVYAARAYGIRLIIPLTDQWDYYHGGKLTFLRFRNLSTSDENAFYTNSEVVSDFKQYIGTLVNRTNTYTDVTYANDPTILCWETGNELKSPPASWTDEIASYIKTLAPNQLVMDGAYGPQTDALSLESVDMYSNHYYPPEKHKLNSDVKLVSSHNKAYYVGEYDWTDKYRWYGMLACLIPLVFVAIAFCLPGRWFPWVFHLPARISFMGSRRKSAAQAQSEYANVPYAPSAYSPLRDTTTSSYAQEAETSKLDSEYPPQVAPMAHKYASRHKIVIRKWMFALSFLLLVPIAAWIALEIGPTSLNHFHKMLEQKDVAGSSYWSLFGRDDNCCQWVEHDDGFTLHYRENMDRSQQLTQHAYHMTGATAAFDINNKEALPVIGCMAADALNSTTS